MLPAVVVAGSHPACAQTLKAVKERGTLNCGVSQGMLGFSSLDDKNLWTGFDVDICRAVAAAIFGDPAKVSFTPLAQKRWSTDVTAWVEETSLGANTGSRITGGFITAVSGSEQSNRKS